MVTHGGDIYRNKVNNDFSINVSPYGIPPAVRSAMREALLEVGHYPDPFYEKLRKAFAKTENTDYDNIICGNGASELIYATVSAVLKNITDKKPAVGLLVPCFLEYEDAINRAATAVINEVYLEEENDFLPQRDDIEKLFADNDLIILGHPNNPTGRLLDDEFLQTILKKAALTKTYIILDESFIDLTKKSHFECANDYVIKIKSFTKSMAIPGVRIGYAVCTNTQIRNDILKFLPEWNVSIIAEYAGIASVNSYDWLREKITDEKTGLFAEKEFVKNALLEMGIKVFDSDTSFLLIKSSINLYDALLSQGILIRKCDNFSGLDSEFFRIAIKSHEENLLLINAIKLINEKCEAKSVNEDRKILAVKPDEIEGLSFEILTKELSGKGIYLTGDAAPVIKRCIHTTADFEYASSLEFSENAVNRIKELIKAGANIVTDTNMALTGINKTELSKHGVKAFCFMADPLIAKMAKERGVTRAYMSMEYAASLAGSTIYVIGNAPTALISICELIDKTGYKPGFVIAVPVGFVNVETAKEMIIDRKLDYIVNRGRKGGSNVAAAIVNAILYEIRKENS